MIRLSPWKQLLLEAPSQPGRGAFLSAASGILRLDDQLYIIADDENALGIFPLHGDQPGKLAIVFNEDLPLSFVERKAAKADFECITHLPGCAEFPQGAVMALGSGSKKRRRRGVLMPLAPEGNLSGAVISLELSQLYEQLQTRVGKLNIEGAVFAEDHLVLFQRGNKKNRFNGTIRVPIAQFFGWISGRGEQFSPLIREHPLGDIQGVPLCFTDATRLANGDILFTAAAEDTEDSVIDGANLGSAVGIIRNDQLIHLETVDLPIKIEGISATLGSSGVELLLVTDADDASKPANLFQARLDYYPV